MRSTKSRFSASRKTGSGVAPHSAPTVHLHDSGLNTIVHLNDYGTDIMENGPSKRFWYKYCPLLWILIVMSPRYSGELTVCTVTMRSTKSRFSASRKTGSGVVPHSALTGDFGQRAIETILVQKNPSL
jgi:hypothetical protein